MARPSSRGSSGDGRGAGLPSIGACERRSAGTHVGQRRQPPLRVRSATVATSTPLRYHQRVPAPWKYESVLAKYVPDVDHPNPRRTPEPADRDERPAWLRLETRRARDYLGERLVAAWGSPPKEDATFTVYMAGQPPVVVDHNPRDALPQLERAIGGDIKAAVRWARAQHKRMRTLQTAARDILKQCARDDDKPAGSPGRFGVREIGPPRITAETEPSIASVELPGRGQSRGPWHRATRLWAYDRELGRLLVQHELLEPLAAVDVACSAVLHDLERAPDPRFMTSVRALQCADPVTEWFSSECLRVGLRPIEAAMIEAIACTSPKKPGERNPSWFDKPDRALRRWRESYERLFQHCGLGPEASAASPSARRLQSGQRKRDR